MKSITTRSSEFEILSSILHRWSPRAMSGEEIGQDELMTVLEAARWAPSSNNTQPWRFVYATRSSSAWPTFFSLLSEGNRSWAHNAGALILILSHSHDPISGKNLRTHSFDTGAAWQNLAIQGCEMGLVVHAMAGFDFAHAPIAIQAPAGVIAEAMVAIGRPGDVNMLEPKHRDRETPSRRHPLETIAFDGLWPVNDNGISRQ